MLIRRDGLMAKPLPTGMNFEKLLSSKSPAVVEYVKQHRDAMQDSQTVKDNNNPTVADRTSPQSNLLPAETAQGVSARKH